VVEDEPLRVRTPQGAWEPTNYDHRFRGTVTFREAMEQSLNVPFARIGLAVGPARIAETAHRLGIESPVAAVPSLSLGSSEVTLLELVRAYGVLAAEGRLAPTRSLLGRARQGAEFPERGDPPPARVADPAAAYLVTSSLEGVVTRGTGAALNQDGRFDGLAGKTGTSNDWRDAWFIAYTPSLAVGVWVGFDDGRSLRMTGATAALPVVARFLEEARAEADWDSFDVPDGISEGWVTVADAGWLSDCGAREYFLEGTEPDGGGCGGFRFRLPERGPGRDWVGELERRAIRIFQRWSERLERARSER
jgi:membrane carboxypeptidase/penicillin-binding protein